MAASSDGQSAIEVVIEKLQEIVDDIQKTNDVKVNRSESTQNPDGNASSNIVPTNDLSKNSVRVERLDASKRDTHSQAEQEIKNSTQINIVPLALNATSEVEPPQPVEPKAKSGPKGTSVVITTVRDKTPSQVVLNFPVDAGEFNIGDTQGLIETLQKLNSVLSKGRESGQKSLLTNNSGGQFTTEVQLYKCAKCDYWSHNKYYLKQHVDLVHNAERVYKCPFCDYAGKRSHSLKEHLVVHSNYRPYVCSQCNASFRKKGHLTNHVKMHSQYKSQGNPVCPICVKNNFENLLALHIHLREAHPSEVYSCDICQYATFLNKGNITMHMLTHGNPKVYTCSACTFTALHQRIMEEHIMEEHIIDAQSLPINVIPESIQVNEGSGQSEVPKIWLKCTECGFSTTERDTLHDHMIAKHLNVQEVILGQSKPKEPAATASTVTTRPSQAVTAQAAALKELMIQEDGLNKQGSDYARIRQVIENPAPYKCWHCPYEINVAFQFITHMLKHRPKPEAPAARQAQTVTELVGQPQVVVPKQVRKAGATPDPPATAQPYMYDESNKWYQCTLCGYSSEHQRTIKAHIWKHSGHKDLDYPMFQNGPLSVYDDPLAASNFGDANMGKTVSCLKPVSPVHQVNDDLAPTSVVANTSTSLHSHSYNAPVSSGPMAAKLVPSISPSSVPQTDPNKNYIVVRISSKELKGSKTIDEQIKEIISQLDVVPDEVVIYNPEEELREANTPVQAATEFKTENQRGGAENLVVKSEVVSPVKMPAPGESTNKREVPAHFDPSTVQTSCAIENLSSSTILNAEAVKLCKVERPLMNATQNTSVKEEQNESQTIKPNITPQSRVIHPYATQQNGETASANQPSDYVEELQENIPPNSQHRNTQHTTNAPEMAAEVSIHSQESSPIASPEPEEVEDIEVDVETCDVVTDNEATIPRPVHDEAFIPRPEAQTSPKSTQLRPPDMAAEISVRSNSCDQDQQSQDSSTDDDSSQMSGSYDNSDAEIITLLTLLKKGPNFNPACPTVGQSNELAKQRLEGLANAVRQRVELSATDDHRTPGSGISSSLLAVIEQLRERTNSTSESPGDVPIASRLRKRKRRREEDIEKLMNIEVTESGGYKCLCCFYHHSSLENMRLHMRLHEARGPHQCSLCDYEGTCSEDLQEHMLQHCKTRTFQCKICTAVFGYKSQLRAHMCAHEDAKLLGCTLCDFKTTDEGFLAEHSKTHANKKQIYICKLCEAPFHTYEGISKHVAECEKSMEADVGGKRQCKREYTCDYCPFVAHTQALLKTHMRTHDQDQNLQCSHCGFVAHSIRSLKSHMKRHVNDQRFVEQPLEQYKCNLCGYVCHHLPSLKSHMWRHASDKNYNYEQINDIINRALEYDEATAKQTLAADQSQQPNYLILFRCCQCGYESVHKSLLNAHMKTHMDIIQKTLEVNEERLVQKTTKSPARLATVLEK